MVMMLTGIKEIWRKTSHGWDNAMDRYVSFKEGQDVQADEEVAFIWRIAWRAALR